MVDDNNNPQGQNTAEGGQSGSDNAGQIGAGASSTDNKGAGQSSSQPGNGTGQQGSQQPDGGGTSGAEGEGAKGSDNAGAKDKGFLGGDGGADEGQPDNTPYEISYPEGFVEDKETVEAVTPLLHKLGASKEQVQQLFDAGCKLIARIEDNVLTTAMETEKKWVEELSGDADFGGANFKESKSAASAFVRKFAGSDAQALIEMLDAYHISANPMLFKMLARAGKAMAQEGKFVTGGSRGVSGNKMTDEELVNTLCPNSMKE